MTSAARLCQARRQPAPQCMPSAQTQTLRPTPGLLAASSAYVPLWLNGYGVLPLFKGHETIELVPHRVRDGRDASLRAGFSVAAAMRLESSTSMHQVRWFRCEGTTRRVREQRPNTVATRRNWPVIAHVHAIRVVLAVRTLGIKVVP